jgi:hypothetical protein
MKKHTFFTLFILFLFSSLSFAQFDADKSTIGLGVGYGGGGLDGESALPFTAEFNFYKINDNVQGGIFVSYASTSEEVNFITAKGEWTYTNIIAAAQVNYHFSPGKKFDPFVGASLGYNFASASWEWDGNSNLPEPSADAGAFFYSGQAGFNYWFSPSMAAQVRVGYYPYISAGIHFTL